MAVNINTGIINDELSINCPLHLRRVIFLPAQLESLLEQSLLPGELVVSDDASTDGTVQLLEAFKENAPFEVKLILTRSDLGRCKTLAGLWSYAGAAMLLYVMGKLYTFARTQ